MRFQLLIVEVNEPVEIVDNAGTCRDHGLPDGRNSQRDHGHQKN
jgi:hypothetical protein